MEYKFLNKINSPEDLRRINDKDIPLLADEIRHFLVNTANQHGGHLASNLGVVEMTLAIHKVFDSPRDHIIFDVGHQAYVHKMITGRLSDFENLRTPGGLSGFTLRRESEHDPFGAGHSSTSVSAALGFAIADSLKQSTAHTVCVLGDGAYTGGMVHEALNNCKPDLPLVIILNENGMSISRNSGTFASYISRVRNSRKYIKLKEGTNTFLSKIPLIGNFSRKVITALKNLIKRLIYSSNYFEELGLKYMGPIDGNDYEKTIRALELAKEMNKTVVVHLKTVKGKGFAEAESSPEGYHNVTTKKKTATYNSVFAEELISLAECDERVVAVTAAMGIGTGLDRFGERFQDRYFDVGIAEAHALTFSAALAANGYLPYIALYSTFLQRGYDSIIHDIALQELPVRIMIDRAGLAVADGATHHGIFDVSLLSAMPGVKIFAPSSFSSLREMMAGLSKLEGAVAIRYPNDKEPEYSPSEFRRYSGEFSPLLNFDEKNPPEYVFVTYGGLLERVLSATQILASRGIRCGVIVVETIKPENESARLIMQLSGAVKRIVYAEEGIKRGGAAESLLSTLVESGFDFSKTEYIISAIDDNFASPTEPCDLYDYVGLSAEKLAKRMVKDDFEL